MKLETLLRNFPTYYFFGDEEYIWAYELNKGIYMQFTHSGNKRYDLEIVEVLTKAEINERFLTDARNFKPLA